MGLCFLEFCRRFSGKPKGFAVFGELPQKERNLMSKYRFPHLTIWRTWVTMPYMARVSGEKGNTCLGKGFLKLRCNLGPHVWSIRSDDVS